MRRGRAAGKQGQFDARHRSTAIPWYVGNRFEMYRLRRRKVRQKILPGCGARHAMPLPRICRTHGYAGAMGLGAPGTYCYVPIQRGTARRAPTADLSNPRCTYY